ncbi:MAG TPA: hypothetical protein VFJ58_03460 [Armatimonadota bacterium]|nr:hypothetical protein [Armatimonadota bacterium]
MSGVTFAARIGDGGLLRVPEAAMKQLDLRPGDEVRVRIDGEQTDDRQARLQQAIADIVKQAQQLVPEPAPASADPCEAAFGEIVRLKYRKQGFEL